VNFLAHLHLSGDNEKILIGNFIADFVKGKVALSTYEPEIKAGILLHRAIDSFTDSHPIVKESKSRLIPKYRHYSGVITDMFYDHFLANRWLDYHSTPLADYSQSIYLTLNQNSALLPEEAKRMLPFMSTHDWLVGYGTQAGMHRALSGLARRTPFESKMEEAVSDLNLCYDLYKAEFATFFPELKKYTKNWLDQQYQSSSDIQAPPIG
jgi:acyl carrier protein phosphodiesterase